MSIKKNIAEELARTPLTITIGVVSILVSVFAAIGALHPPTSGAVVTITHLGYDVTPITVANLLNTVAFFLSISLVAALLMSFLMRRHVFVALMLSVPVAVLTSFFSLMFLQLAPPKPMNDMLVSGVVDAIYYGTLFLYVGIGGNPVADSILNIVASGDVRRHVLTNRSLSEEEVEQTQKAKYTGFYAVLVLVFFGWSALVAAGLHRLVKLFP